MVSENALWRARAEIDIQALRSNVARIKERVGEARILSVIKADAYGHGLDNVTAQIWADVDGFAVATINEGIQCRQIQSSKPVVVLSEFWCQQQLAEFEIWSLDPVIHNQAQLPWVLDYSGSPLNVWIKFDSGMNRLGIDPGDVEAMFNALKKNPSIAKIRVISHLANADMEGDGYTKTQAKIFLSTVRQLDCESSFANTAGVMRWPETHKDWVRPGLMLYGISPYEQNSAAGTGQAIKLRPVMSLKSRIISVKDVDTNQPVGYGGTFVTRRKTRIAMVGVGYGDGYPRVVNDKACVLLNNQRAPVIGRISMDMITVDVTDIVDVTIGDQVTLWGAGLTIEEVAGWAGTIPYELLCKVTPRIPRVLTNTDADGQNG